MHPSHSRWLLRIWIVAIILGILLYEWFWPKDGDYHHARNFWGKGHLVILFVARLLFTIPMLAVFLLAGRWLMQRFQESPQKATWFIFSLLLVSVALSWLLLTNFTGELNEPQWAGFFVSQLIAAAVSFAIMYFARSK